MQQSSLASSPNRPTIALFPWTLTGGEHAAAGAGHTAQHDCRPGGGAWNAELVGVPGLASLVLASLVLASLVLASLALPLRAAQTWGRCGPAGLAGVAGLPGSALLLWVRKLRWSAAWPPTRRLTVVTCHHTSRASHQLPQDVHNLSHFAPGPPCHCCTDAVHAADQV